MAKLDKVQGVQPSLLRKALVSRAGILQNRRQILAIFLATDSPWQDMEFMGSHPWDCDTPRRQCFVAQCKLARDDAGRSGGKSLSVTKQSRSYGNHKNVS
jgi:hypothetical protein